MTRIISALLASMLLASPALAEESGKTKSETVKPDGTKVSVKKKKDIKNDGTGEVTTEVTTENPSTGATTVKRAKVTKEKNDDGTVNTKTQNQTETKR